MKIKDKEICCDYISGENWKAYGNYFVSNYGRVYSCKSARLLKPELIAGKQYFRVTLTINGVKERIRLNRLVAMMFIPNPDSKPFVHHIDGNALNNRADNLMWVTLQEHTQLHRELRDNSKGA